MLRASLFQQPLAGGDRQRRQTRGSVSKEPTEAHALPFATTNYQTDQDGTLAAVLPSRCVYATGAQTCAIFVDHLRERKAGPCHPLAVVGCRTHGGRRYTLYPPGHYPYGRAAVTPYSVTGKLLLDDDRGQPQWQATLFAAALDAKQGRRWPSEQRWWDQVDERRGRTQGRQLEMAGRLTGVAPQLDERAREQIATRLSVATMTVRDGAARWARSWQRPWCSNPGSAARASVQRHAGGPDGGGRRGQRPVGATAPAAGGALGASRRELDRGAGRRFRNAGTGCRRDPSGASSANHENATFQRPRQRYGMPMNDSQRPPLPVSATALQRYLVVAEVEALMLRGWRPGAAVRHVAGTDHRDLDGRPVPVSVRSLQRWRAAWAAGNLAALEPQQRTRTATSVALSGELVAFLNSEKQRDPRASVPELVRRARELGIVSVDDGKIDRTTVWRACRRMGLPTRQRPHKREGDMRRWRYAERMQCVLADGKHFRAGAARLRRVALFLLDDATRYGLAVLVGTAESSELFLQALYQMVLRHGLADLFFLDKGPGFISHDTLAVIQGGLGRLAHPRRHQVSRGPRRRRALQPHRL